MKEKSILSKNTVNHFPVKETNTVYIFNIFESNNNSWDSIFTMYRFQPLSV